MPCLSGPCVIGSLDRKQWAAELQRSHDLRDLKLKGNNFELILSMQLSSQSHCIAAYSCHPESRKGAKGYCDSQLSQTPGTQLEGKLLVRKPHTLLLLLRLRGLPLQLSGLPRMFPEASRKANPGVPDISKVKTKRTGNEMWTNIPSRLFPPAWWSQSRAVPICFSWLVHEILKATPLLIMSMETAPADLLLQPAVLLTRW